jgi:hypothetical protein
MEKWIPGDKDEKWLGNCLDVEDRVLISWLKMDQKTDTQISRNVVWKFFKEDYI